MQENKWAIPEPPETYVDYGVPTGYVPRIKPDATVVGHHYPPRPIESAVPQKDPTLFDENGDRKIVSLDPQGYAQFTKVPEVSEKIHSHYFKDVSKLTHIDVYRVLSLFEVVDPCIQHAVKKLLVAGGRGAGKGVGKDVQEAIDSLRRYQEIQKEDGK